MARGELLEEVVFRERFALAVYLAVAEGFF